MSFSRFSLPLVMCALFCGASALAQETRYVVDGGVTYCETRRLVQRPVYETSLQTTTRTVYREQWSTENKDVVQQTWVPRTQYRTRYYEAEWWNPFAPPYTVARCVPETAWDLRTDTVRVPVASRRLVPETQTVQTPVTTVRYVTEQQVTRVPVGPAPTVGWTATPPAPAAACSPSGATMPAAALPGPVGNGERLGGVVRMTQDPPRYGLGEPAR